MKISINFIIRFSFQDFIKVIDTLFESTACLVGNTASLADTLKGRTIKSFVTRLRKAVA